VVPVTEEQVTNVARRAKQLADGKMTLLFDCEQTGDDGAKEAL
jgi:DNA-directed RNA polymerase subunit K/omega